MHKVLLFNPRSGQFNHRIPNSVMNIAASVEKLAEWTLVDGNLEIDPFEKIVAYLRTGDFKYIGFTVMPGPQTKQAIPLAKKIKEQFPDTVMIWGGYFPSAQYKVILESGYVDFVIHGPGDHAFPALIQALENNTPFELIKNLAWRASNGVIKNPAAELIEQDTLPALPYDKLNTLYSIREHYLGKTFLGKHTLAYHSSIGCPFTCSFCAVVPTYNARWKAKSAERVYAEVKYVKDRWGADSIEFHDNNFFVSEKRAVAFSKLIRPEKMNWWGMARIDTMDRFKDESIAAIREAGCRIIFFGAESGNDEVLKSMDKGGTQNSELILRFAEKMKKFDIIPEYSFVLGMPAPTPELVMEGIEKEIRFIKQVKAVNPKTEIILYTYSPVPTEGSELYKAVEAAGFEFPRTLDAWETPRWEQFTMRKNPLTPWLTPEMIDRIRNFETVLNGYYPTVSDIRLTALKRKLIRLMAGFRYRTGLYQFPYEIKLMHKLWKYRLPETEGF